MESTETIIHSFVIRIWLEEPAKRNNPAKWRGHITHVLSGQRRYMEQLNDIVEFIGSHLEPLDSANRNI